jgi:hypothetical protein
MDKRGHGSAVLEPPSQRPTGQRAAPRHEEPECTCPEFCERDHDND